MAEYNIVVLARKRYNDYINVENMNTINHNRYKGKKKYNMVVATMCKR